MAKPQGATSEAKARAEALKAGPNTIVEDIGSTKSRVQMTPDPEPSEKVTPVAERKLSPMSLKNFLALEFGARRADQAAGFTHHAKHLGPRTIHEWREAFAEFGRRPIK